MTSDKLLRRKWTLKAGDQQVVFVKSHNERSAHVLMKAFLWALYLPQYPNLAVEIKIGDRFKPDVVSLDKWGDPIFWGEAGQVSVRKLQSLFRRFPHTHFAISKWDTNLRPHLEIVQDALDDFTRAAPIDLIAFPNDSADRFIDARGYIELTHEDVDWLRLSE